MATKSTDLDQFRHDAAAVTGNPVADYGMLPDPAHLSGGGYHCGLTDLVRIGKFHYPRSANVGSGTEDYSARQARDRNAIDDRCAAVDGPDDWPNGGRAAWIRHNNMVVAQMRAGDPELAALRAVNFTPDGKVKRRYDSLHPEAGVISSTDTVLWHTHYEFWRDTLGTPLMQRCLARLLQIMRAAIANTPLPGSPTTEDDMPFNATVKLGNGQDAIVTSDGTHCLWVTAETYNFAIARFGPPVAAPVRAVGVLVGPPPSGWVGLVPPTMPSVPSTVTAVVSEAQIDAIATRAGAAARNGAVAIADLRAALVDVLLHGAAPTAGSGSG